ncbi:hypothetical protein [Streptomyces scabiei]|uniref:hypothetical protein n=1 Tax=Streptomyces scabiei TaxID=1930 RepID=UPI0011802CDF|nr:hypothetical protein [Streptomyces scabiei]
MEPAYPEMIRDEQCVRPFDGWQGCAHVRAWRSAPDQVTVMISGLSGGCTLRKLLPLLRDEYPGDVVQFFFHVPSDWTALGYYAALTVGDDGTVVQTRMAGDTLAARLGPTLYATEDPDDETSGYGGA